MAGINKWPSTMGKDYFPVKSILCVRGASQKKGLKKLLTKQDYFGNYSIISNLCRSYVVLEIY